MPKSGWSRINLQLLRRTAFMTAVLTLISVFYHYAIRVNSTTASLTDLIVVLGAATIWGLPEAMLASAVSMLYLDYYFYPPVPQFGIEDPQNWLAWCTFLITAVVVSELSTRLKKRALEATQRQREIERLYALSQSLMQGSSADALAQAIPSQVAMIFGCPGVALFDCASGQIYGAGATGEIPEVALIGAARSGNLPESSSPKSSASALPQASNGAPAILAAVSEPRVAAVDRSPALVPVNLGAYTIGSLGFTGAAISPPAMQSIANLVALALDRVRKQEAAGKAEGARRHQELKSMLLDALAHEFQTPLTSIRAGIDSLLAAGPGGDQQEWLEIMDEESGRLSAMMTEAIQMARIEAGHVDLDKQTHTVEDLVYSALAKEIAAAAQVHIDLPQGLPPVAADAGLIRLVIRQITGNAMKYSHPGAAVRVSAHLEEGGVVISVTDRGPGIPPEEQRQIFEKYYRGKQSRGHLTGMGMGLPIARQIVEAHDGRVWLESQPGEGATFSFILPLAHEEANA